MRDRQNAVEMVRYGYDEDTRNLRFRVGFLNGVELKNALVAIEVIDQYNDFDRHNVVPAVEKVAKEQLGQWAYIWIGREMSPVIYFETTTLDGDLDHQEIENIMREAKCDEYDVEETDRETIIRCWWD